jgi:hypothetical protein
MNSDNDPRLPKRRDGLRHFTAKWPKSLRGLTPGHICALAYLALILCLCTGILSLLAVFFFRSLSGTQVESSLVGILTLLLWAAVQAGRTRR